jgi:hypothetical protein
MVLAAMSIFAALARIGACLQNVGKGCGQTGVSGEMTIVNADGCRARARTKVRFAGAARALLMLVLALVGGRLAMAEEPPPLPAPHVDLLTSGVVRAVVRLGDGSLVIGGYFDSINGVPRSNIARLRPDGSLDPNWNPSADQSVGTLAVGPDGSIYAGGSFSTIGGRARSRLAKIAPGGAGVVDAAWAPAADADIAALAIDSLGSVYVGGSFSTIGGTARNGLAKVSGTGSGALDASWNPAPSAGVDTLAIDAADTLYVGGRFLAIGGQSRKYLAKVASSGVVDPLWNPSADGEVYTILLDGNQVYVGGAFFTIGAATRNFVAKLSSSGTGAADTRWNAASNGYVYALAKGADGALYAGGMFSAIGGVTRNRLARLSADDGGADTTWDASADDNVLALSANADGSLVVGGEFANIGARQHLGFALVDPFGETNTGNVDAEIPGHANETVEQADGSLLVVGEFWKAGQQVRTHLLRIKPDGQLDPDWKPLANGFVYTLAQDADGSVYVGGVFTTINGIARNRLARLSGSGTGALDALWNPGADGPPMTLAVLPGVGLFVGGSFQHVGGLVRSNLAKVSTAGAGAVDTTWNPSMDTFGHVAAMALDGSGGLFVGGHFTFIASTTRSNLAKIATTGAGSADATWNPSPNGDVTSLILDGAGNIYTGGSFTTIGGRSRNYVAKLSATGTGAASASWSAALDSFVYTLALDAHGGLFAGGVFGHVGAVSRTHLARLSAIDGALDAAWDATAAGDWVISLASVGDDAVAVGGNFTAIGGVPRTGLAVLRSAPRVTTTIVLSPGGTSIVTAPVVFSATLASAIDVNGGIVTIGDGGSSCTSPVVHSAASCAVGFAHAGLHQVVATYSGDEQHQPAVSPAVTQTVQPAATSLAIASQSPNPSIPGQPVTVSVNLQLAGGALGPATGAISIAADDGASCAIVLPATSCALAFTTRGVQQVAAHYPGNADFLSSDASSQHAINFQPIAADDEATTNEDQPFTVNATDGVLSNDEDPDGNELVVGDEGPRTAGGIGGIVTVFYDGSYEYAPPPDANGDATFEYTPYDGLENAPAEATVTIHVRPANDPPTISIPSSLHLGAGPFGVRETPGFATMTSSGPGENDQPLAWQIRTLSDPSGLFFGEPSISLDGTLSTQLTGRGGSATLAVSLIDDGGTENGGNDTSAEQTFTLTVDAGADLSISIVDGTELVTGGGIALYEVRVRNFGPVDVTSARATFATSANLSDLEWTCVPFGGATCSASGSGPLSDTLVLPRDSGADYEVTAHAIVLPELPVETTATITLLTGATDFNPANDTAHDVDVTGVMQGVFDPPYIPPE